MDAKRTTAQRKPTPRYQPTPRRIDGKPARAGKARGETSRASVNAGTSRGGSAGGRHGGSGSRDGGASRGGSKLPFIAGGVGAIVVIALLVGVIGPAVGDIFSTGEPEGPYSAPRVSLVAVGDNLPDDFIGWYADGQAGEMDDGLYDYSPVYKPLLPYIQAADLAYINEETHLGGDDIGPQGYPSFNATDAMAAAVVDAGFDLVASASNHSYDWGQGALEHSLALWERQPVAFTGTSVTEEQYNRIPVVERNGITFALLNYTYGVNYDLEKLPPHTINLIDDARIIADVGRAHEMADVVLVAMHWGTELLTEADDEQLRLAQLLADLDVDVVLGSHPHVIGPMAWVASSTNPDHRTLVAYSLGNFLADHEAPLADNVLEGMLTCDFVRNGEDGPVTVENVRWVPLVCHSSQERSDFAVYALDDYTAEQAKQCRTLSEIENPINWLYEETVRIVGPEWF